VKIPDLRQRNFLSLETTFPLVAQPCSECGSSRQSATVHATAAIGSTVTTGPGISLTFNRDQPWSVRWYELKQSLSAVEEVCRPDHYQGSDAVKKAIRIFFTDCFHMGDWLWEDKSRTNLTETEVREFIKKHPSLRVSDGFANTDKHRVRNRVRNQAGAITAQIRTVTLDTNEIKVVIEWGTHGSTPHTEDALDLARRCVAAWEEYLKAKGLQSPI